MRLLALPLAMILLAVGLFCVFLWVIADNIKNFAVSVWVDFANHADDFGRRAQKLYRWAKNKEAAHG